MAAAPDARFDEWQEFGEERLCEAALRLLAALGSEPRFPADARGFEALLGRVAEGRPSEPIEIRIESAEELPRYRSDFGVWASPFADGCLRLRHETGDMRSLAVVLAPDGTLGEFEWIEGFGVPEEEWTEQARADVEAIARRQREIEAAEPERQRKAEEREQRFQLRYLLGSRAAPPQVSDGPIVTFVALYITGLVIYYLVPRPPDAELETEDPWAEPEFEASLPEIEIADGLGTAYELADFGTPDVNGPLMRARQAFVPAPPAAATRLTVGIGSASVEIELGER